LSKIGLNHWKREWSSFTKDYNS